MISNMTPMFWNCAFQRPDVLPTNANPQGHLIIYITVLGLHEIIPRFHSIQPQKMAAMTLVKVEYWMTQVILVLVFVLYRVLFKNSNCQSKDCFNTICLFIKLCSKSAVCSLKSLLKLHMWWKWDMGRLFKDVGRYESPCEGFLYKEK